MLLSVAMSVLVGPAGRQPVRAEDAVSAKKHVMTTSDHPCFPLAPDSRWHYDIQVVRSSGEAQRLSAVKYVKDTRQIAGKHYVRIVTEVTGGTLRVPDQLYRVGTDGVYAAVQGAEGKEFLVLPTDPKTRNSWSGEARPAISRIAGQATTGETFRHGPTAFDNCIKVSLSMTILERSLFGGQAEVPVRLDRWFAPGVGLVRELRIVGTEGERNYLKLDSKLTQFTPTKER